MSDLSKRMRELVKAAESADQSVYCDAGMTSADEELFDAVRPFNGSSGLLNLCDEVERLEADNALLDRNFRNLQTRLDAIHDFASRCDVEQKNEPDEIITAMIDGIRSVARFIEDDADGYANAMRRRIDALEKENAEIRAEVEILRRERSLLIKKGDSQ